MVVWKPSKNFVPTWKLSLPALSMFVFVAQEGCIDDNDDDDKDDNAGTDAYADAEGDGDDDDDDADAYADADGNGDDDDGDVWKSEIKYRCRSSTGVKDCMAVYPLNRTPIALKRMKLNFNYDELDRKALVLCTFRLIQHRLSVARPFE